VADSYRIFGAEMSPYSVKVRSYFRYKGIPHQWILRIGDSQAEFETHARMPIIPLLVTPAGTSVQDPTPGDAVPRTVDPSGRHGGWSEAANKLVLDPVLDQAGCLGELRT
jgi:hypothetical protein